MKLNEKKTTNTQVKNGIDTTVDQNTLLPHFVILLRYEQTKDFIDGFRLFYYH